jgi:glycosyltransferase involved in cell wall biosynthesis
MSECVPGGGAEQFALTTIRNLTAAGYEVTLYTQQPVNRNEFNRVYGDVFPCKTIVRQIPLIPGVPRRYRTLLEELWFKSVNDHLLFDLSPGILPFYPRLPDIVYFHGPWLPQMSSLLKKNGSNHVPSLWSLPYELIVKASLGRFFASKRITMLTNSHFTSDRLASVGLRAGVLYPPVDLDLWHPREDYERHGAVSFARFSRNYPFKRQEWQLKIIREKKVDLLMMGTARSAEELTYLEFLKAIAKSNVEFLPNVDLEIAMRNLWARKVFLCTAESEPFGITVVQAIAAGCLPLVYDHGGPREIVPFSELRFNSIHEARLKLDLAIKGRYDYLKGPLLRHIRIFGIDRFRHNLLTLLRQVRSKT